MTTPFNRYVRFEITDVFWRWISPLLYYPENEILLNYIELTSRGFRLINLPEIRSRFNLTKREVGNIRTKLESLARLFELQVAAGLFE